MHMSPRDPDPDYNNWKHNPGEELTIGKLSTYSYISRGMTANEPTQQTAATDRGSDRWHRRDCYSY